MEAKRFFIVIIFCLQLNLCLSQNSVKLPDTILRFIKSQTNKVRNRVLEVTDSQVTTFDPDEHKNVTQLITSKGYPCEEHTVKTKDGFFLGVQRIPHGKNSTPGNRPVVFLQHGLLCSSSTWVINKANESLAFLLADAGFDVWLGNSRGNTYSRRHVFLKPDQEEFWAWSWDEMAQYDLPAQVEFALQKSGQKDLYYIAHSQGTTQAFARFSQDHALASKIKMMFALAPVVTIRSTESPVRYFKFFTDKLMYLILGRRGFLTNNKLIDIAADSVCVNKDTRFLCTQVIFIIVGSDTKNFNQSRLPVYISQVPAGTSVRDMVHFVQQIRTGLFQKYDYGCSEENKKHYNQTTPPVYDVNKLNIPLYIFSGQNDFLADPTDIARLKASLTRGQIKGSFEIPNWNHLDFIWGLDARQEVYDRILDIMKKN